MNIVNDDYDLLVQDGVSQYKCAKCVKRKNDDDDQVPTPRISTTEYTMDAETDTDDILCAAAGSSTSKKDMQAVLEELVDQFARLKAENASLRQEVRRLNDTVSLFVSQRSRNISDTTDRSRPSSYASATVEFPALSSRQQSPPRPRKALPADTSANAIGPTGLFPPAASTAQRDSVPRSTVDGDGFTLVTRRKPVKPSVGTSKASKIAVIQRAPQERALFVSRLSPETSTKDVEDLVAAVLQGSHLFAPM